MPPDEATGPLEFMVVRGGDELVAPAALATQDIVFSSLIAPSKSNGHTAVVENSPTP